MRRGRLSRIRLIKADPADRVRFRAGLATELRRGQLDAGTPDDPRQVPDSEPIPNGTCVFQMPRAIAPSVRLDRYWPARWRLPGPSARIGAALREPDWPPSHAAHLHHVGLLETAGRYPLVELRKRHLEGASVASLRLFTIKRNGVHVRGNGQRAGYGGKQCRNRIDASP